MFDDIAVIGSGAWGTALALATAKAGRRVALWSRDPDQAASMRATRENTKRLPGIHLLPSITPTSSLQEAVTSARAIILAIPAQYVRELCEALSLVLKSGLPVIIAAKGIDRRSCEFMSEIVADALPGAMPARNNPPIETLPVAP